MSKSDQLARALGAVDEVNSWVGVCREDSRFKIQGSIIEKELIRIQTNLLTVGSMVAGSGKRLSDKETKRLERLIDKLTLQLPKLANFIYPVGELQVARAVARRAEREVIALKDSGFKIQDSIEILKYLNRLSDALFTMGRWVNFKKGIDEEVWKG